MPHAEHPSIDADERHYRFGSHLGRSRSRGGTNRGSRCGFASRTPCMTRGQYGWLDLHRMELTFTTRCRFDGAHGEIRDYV